MLSWQIWMLAVQVFLLGTIAVFVALAFKRLDARVQGTTPSADEDSVDYREVQSLLSLVSRVLTEHAGELGRFEQSLQRPSDGSSPTADELDNHLRQVRMANQKVEQTIDTTLGSLVSACGELLSQETDHLEDYRRRTVAFDNKLKATTREALLAAIATKLIEMVGELRTENATVREQVAAAKDKTIELMSRAHSAEQTARTDALTQLPNRRAFDENHAECHTAFERTGEPYAVVLLDLDHFKQVNDRHGHAVGDAVLAMVGRIFLENRRTTDHLCRMGGEEFALLLPKCDFGVATLVADRYRQRIEAAVLRANNEQISVTVSCGVAIVRPHESKGRVLERADTALYAAKAEGRNRVCADHGTDQVLSSVVANTPFQQPADSETVLAP